MATKAQVIVRQTENLPPPLQGKEPEVERQIYLYRATDGHPELMAEAFYTAFCVALTPRVRAIDDDGRANSEDCSHEAIHVDVVAGYLCASLPGQLVPRHDARLYEDVDHIFVIDVEKVDAAGTMGRPNWYVSHYIPRKAYRKEPSLDRCEERCTRVPVAQFRRKHGRK